MKGRRVLPIATAIAAITLGATITVFYNHYTPPRLRSPFPITHTNYDTLRVVYIGDSWAAMHNGYDSQLQQTLEDSLQQPVKVVSAGFPGKTSKQIYECLFDDKMLHSLISQGCHFCFISAGINDTYQKMSTKYYKQSMDGIIQLLLANDIHPIILEIPDYDIIKAYRHQKASRQWLRRFSMLVTCTFLTSAYASDMYFDNPSISIRFTRSGLRVGALRLPEDTFPALLIPLDLAFSVNSRTVESTI